MICFYCDQPLAGLTTVWTSADGQRTLLAHPNCTAALGCQIVRAAHSDLFRIRSDGGAGLRKWGACRWTAEGRPELLA